MKQNIVKAINKGRILIYPTDTIYGIGTDATNSKSVKVIRKLKNSKKPFSIIASKEWIRKNCVLRKEHEKYLRKLPGKYTFIIKLKNKKAISKEVNYGKDTIGVRIPKHPFTKYILASKKPFITTSVNITNKKFATNINEIPKKFKKHAIIINAGKLKAKPSKIYDLTQTKARRIR
ncbi:MAG: threonylcarbamoyl-AMP synthase [Nanoarchaeota archaeon]|nr:threonylcarbamoyl-AMP synthase [Nanoarchaeota archaeon]